MPGSRVTTFIPLWYCMHSSVCTRYHCRHAYFCCCLVFYWSMEGYSVPKCRACPYTSVPPYSTNVPYVHDDKALTARSQAKRCPASFNPTIEATVSPPVHTPERGRLTAPRILQKCPFHLHYVNYATALCFTWCRAGMHGMNDTRYQTHHIRRV